ncbi:histidine phosphatase family protein [Actinomadura craniellae]|uniref:Histidine phosphatase family protein n=1 Tax=Actinomadura craniellae TaxID=2231787 RepID=A0A365H764_9ACTN|nr:histidine phosphatase family protein [Actinomadura craniellae]
MVLRHAKAVEGIGMIDIDRPLNGRGRRDAAATGDWLRETGLVPDRVLCSTAQRTRETLAGLALDVPADFEARLYGAEAEDVLAVVRETADEVGTLLIIGHNPAFHEVVHDLTGEAPAAFPTCALAVIDLPGGWAEAWPGAGSLTTVRTPKG